MKLLAGWSAALMLQPIRPKFLAVEAMRNLPFSCIKFVFRLSFYRVAKAIRLEIAGYLRYRVRNGLYFR
jgi:hypothetical protein